jgi:predicted Zn-dependent protease
VGHMFIWWLMSQKRHFCIFQLFMICFFALVAVQGVYAQEDGEYPVLSSTPWDHSPVTVYIDEVNVPEHYSPTYSEQVKVAMRYWENGGNGHLGYDPEFNLVDAESDADVYIMWVENLEKNAGAGNGVAGFTRPHEVNGKYVQVDIVLEAGDYQGYAWRQYGDANMREVAKHELGHALGLGHSTDRRDIMYPTYDQKDNINPILVEKTKPFIYVVVIACISLIFFSGINWLRYRGKRRSLENKLFGGKNGRS